MKIFCVDKVREADRFTIENEPISSIDLMERAATKAFDYIQQKLSKPTDFLIFCGPGNNGGDGLVIARLLSKAQHRVKLVILNIANKFSDDFLTNKERLHHSTQVLIEEWTEMPKNFPKISQDTYVIDAILGSGLSKPLKNFPAQLVKWLNTLPNITISIDIATGLFANMPNDYAKDIILKPDYTLSFQFPKLAFFMPENDEYVGEWHILDIALAADYIDNQHTPYTLICSDFVKHQIKHRPKFMHKGMAGHLLMVAGSMYKMGAALLSAKAAFRTGCGLLSLHHPKEMHLPLVSSLPEMMSDEDESKDSFSTLPKRLEKYSALAIGPGLGTASQTVNAFKMIIQEWRKPMLIDADALNILSANPTFLSFLPPYSILSPHVGELDRLIGKCHNGYKRLEKTIAFAVKYQVIVLIKGAHTAVVMPNKQVFFNSTGNSGMATAGAGDVLSGIIGALLAQAYEPKQAAIVGVYLHGLAGDIAAQHLSNHSLMASDIVNFLPEAYKKLIVNPIRFVCFV